MQTGNQYGMQTMNAALADHVRHGPYHQGTGSEAHLVPDELERLLLVGAAIKRIRGRGRGPKVRALQRKPPAADIDSREGLQPKSGT